MAQFTSKIKTHALFDRHHLIPHHVGGQCLIALSSHAIFCLFNYESLSSFRIFSSSYFFGFPSPFVYLLFLLVDLLLVSDFSWFGRLIHFIILPRIIPTLYFGPQSYDSRSTRSTIDVYSHSVDLYHSSI